MSAVSPSRVGKTFDDAALREIVDTISNVVYLLEIEIVIFTSKCVNNFSCRYVVADILGPTICVRRGACCVANSRECPQLSQGAEGWHSQGMCYWTVDGYLC